MSELSGILFIVLDICLDLTAAQAKKKKPIDIALAITLVWTSERANPILICDVICRCLRYN